MSSESPRVAKPSYPTARPVTKVVVPVIPVVDEEVEAPWLTREMIKGWASSVVLHALLLLCLGFWYFAPKVNKSGTFDTRLAGSERGVEEGLSNTGGLNTALTIPEASSAEL